VKIERRDNVVTSITPVFEIHRVGPETHTGEEGGRGGVSPSPGSSLAQVSAVMRLAMKRWLLWGLTQCCGGPEEGGADMEDMEDEEEEEEEVEVMWGHVMTEPMAAEEEDKEEEEEDSEEEEVEVGSRVVARWSFSRSTSMESSRT